MLSIKIMQVLKTFKLLICEKMLKFKIKSLKILKI